MMNEFETHSRENPPKFFAKLKDRFRAAHIAFRTPECLVDDDWVKMVGSWNPSEEFAIVYRTHSKGPSKVLIIPSRLKSQIRVALNQMNCTNGFQKH